MAENSETYDPKEAERVKQRLMGNPRFNDLFKLFENDVKKEKPKFNYEKPYRLKNVDNDIYSNRGKNMKEKINFLKNDILYNNGPKRNLSRNENEDKIVCERHEPKNNYFEFKK
jgi:hypothetical protein